MLQHRVVNAHQSSFRYWPVSFLLRNLGRQQKTAQILGPLSTYRKPGQQLWVSSRWMCLRVCSHIHLKSAYQISKPLINMNSMSNSSPINLAMQIKQKILLKYSEILYFCNTVASPLFESGEKLEHLRWTPETRQDQILSTHTHTHTHFYLISYL